MPLYGVDIMLLIFSTCSHITFFGADNGKRSHYIVVGSGCFHIEFHVGLLKAQVHLAWAQFTGRAGFIVQMLKNVGGGASTLRITIKRKYIASIFDLNIEALLDLLKVFVKLAAELGESMSIVRFQSNGVRCGISVQMFLLGPQVNQPVLRIAALAKK